MCEEKIVLLKVVLQVGKERRVSSGQKIELADEFVAVERAQATVLEPHREVEFVLNHGLEHLFMVALDRDDSRDFLQLEDNLDDLPGIGATVNKIPQKYERIAGVGCDRPE